MPSRFLAAGPGTTAARRRTTTAVVVVVLVAAAAAATAAAVAAYRQAAAAPAAAPKPLIAPVAADPRALYGILVTGRTPARVAMARLAVQQFWAQAAHLPSDVALRLLIVNQGPHPVVLPPSKTQTQNTNLLEIPVRKDAHALTLGDLRNIALAYVPPGSLWITWDDDDVRAPAFLATLFKAYARADADVVSFAQRLEVNAQTGLVWRTQLRSGFVHSLVRARPDVRFRSLDTLEDAHLKALYAALGLRHVVLQDAAPALYLRLVHGDNTSPYVQPHKTAPLLQPPAAVADGSADWSEHPVDEATARAARRAVAPLLSAAAAAAAPAAASTAAAAQKKSAPMLNHPL